MAQEPGRIEVQLSLLSGADSAAAKQIADQLETIAIAMSHFKAADFVQAADKLTQVAEKLAKENSRAAEAASKMQTGKLSSGASTTTGTRSIFEQLGGILPNSVQDATRAVANANRDQAAETNRQTQREARQQLEQNRMENIRTVVRERSGDPNPSEIDPFTGERGGAIRIPRFGELNIQDYLNLARDLHERRAARYGEGTEGFEANINRAATLDRGSRYVGYAYAGREAIRSIFARARSASALNLDSNLGYSRDSNAFSDVFGWQTPFGSAQAEGARQLRDTYRMRFQAGINEEQANAITQASISAGFGGQTGSDLRMDFMAPLFRRYGVDPNALVPFTQTLRTGTSSIEELNSVLGDLGETARSANVDVNQAAQSLASAGEAAQGLGGSYISGVQYGRTFMQGTGLTAEVGNRLAQNPIVQAYIAAQTGLPGMVQGALPASTHMQGTRQALAEMVDAFSGSFGNQVNNVRDPRTGEIVSRQRTSDRDLAIGAAAQQLGINYDEAKAIMDRTDRQQNSEFFNAIAQQYEGEVSNLSFSMDPEVANRRRRAIERQTGGRFDRNGNLVVQGQGQILAGRGGGYRVPGGQRVIKAGSDELNKLRENWVNEELWNSRSERGVPLLRELHRAARGMGVSQGEWEDRVDDEKDPRKRAINARRLIADKSAENKARYEIVMRGEAEKYFKVLAKEQNWKFTPDEPSNVTATSPNAYGLTERSASASRLRGPGG